MIGGIYIKKKDDFYTAKRDIVFKTIFCDEDKPDLLIALLSSILEIKINKFLFLNTELKITYIGERRKIVDLFVLVNDNMYVHLEVNGETTIETIFRNYAFFYHQIATKTLKSEDYNLDDEFIHIDLSYGLGKKEYDIKEVYTFKNETGEIERLTNVKGYEFNMDKISDMWYSEDEEFKSKYKYLVMLDMNKEKLEELSEKYKGDEVIMAYKTEVIKLNESERFASLVTYEQDIQFMGNTQRNLGRKEGLNEGISIGRVEGISIGRDEGLNEAKQKFAISLLADGVPINKIAKYTSLSKKEIKALKANKD